MAVIYAVLMLAASAHTFTNPAQSAMVPQLVPLSIFENAAVWNSSAFQIATVVGPALGGLIIALNHQARWVYVINAVLAMLFFTCIALIRTRQPAREKESISMRSLVAGFSFIKESRVILAAITLDMFAVLLGGVVTLMPVFAKDILHVGPVGLGWLRAAPSVGALLMALVMAHRPPLKNAGRTLFWVVIGFGLTTIVFGLSKLFWLSMAMLVLNGALDNVSVIIRMTLVQISTPDAMRGRVASINSIFIGSSNELGGFESGLVAYLFGPVFSAVFGGVGTILAVLAVTALWPELMRLKSLTDLQPLPIPDTSRLPGQTEELTP